MAEKKKVDLSENIVGQQETAVDAAPENAAVNTEDNGETVKKTVRRRKKTADETAQSEGESTAETAEKPVKKPAARRKKKTADETAQGEGESTADTAEKAVKKPAARRRKKAVSDETAVQTDVTEQGNNISSENLQTVEKTAQEEAVTSEITSDENTFSVQNADTAENYKADEKENTQPVKNEDVLIELEDKAQTSVKEEIVLDSLDNVKSKENNSNDNAHILIEFDELKSDGHSDKQEISIEFPQYSEVSDQPYDENSENSSEDSSNEVEVKFNMNEPIKELLQSEDKEDKSRQKKKKVIFKRNKKEKPVHEESIKRKIERKHRRRIAIGFVMVVLMAIGLASIVFAGISGVQMLLDDTDEKEMYNQLLATLVVSDPLPFESVEQADQDMILASCVWAAVMNEDMSKFEKNEFDQTCLPTVEVDKYFAKLFGTQYTLEHRTFSDQGVEFYYEEDRQAYAIPATSFPTGYTPKVEEIKKVDGDKIVTVGYIPPSTSWTDVSDGKVSKYVDYIFQKQGDNYYLVAIRESEKTVEVTASQAN